MGKASFGERVGEEVWSLVQDLLIGDVGDEATPRSNLLAQFSREINRRKQVQAYLLLRHVHAEVADRIGCERGGAVDEADPIAALGNLACHHINGALIGEIGAKEFRRSAVNANGAGDTFGAFSRAVVVNANRPAVAR